MYKPTDEQQAFIDAALARTSIAGQAGAGTGKTTTAEAMIKAIKEASGGRATIIYIVYNKAMQLEANARFGHLAEVRTAHSLAFSVIGKYYSARLGNRDTIKPWHLAASLGYRKPITDVNSAGVKMIVKPRSLAAIARQTLGEFYHSADPQIGHSHVRLPAGCTGPVAEAITEAAINGATIMWEDQQLSAGKHHFTHDTYLKMFGMQLAQFNWQMPYKVIVLDEAQDINPVFADVIDRQTTAQRIALGDSAQAIYGWRGCEDYLADFARFPGVTSLSLTQSWRFGQAIADEGNLWLRHGDFGMRIVGAPAIDSRIGQIDPTEPYAVLNRTNAGAVDAAICAAGDGRRVHIAGGAAKAIDVIEDVLRLKDGEEAKHPLLSAVRDYRSLKELIASHLIDDQEVTIAVKVAEEHGHRAVEAIRACNADPETADVIAATSHSYKGKESDQVIIGSDFTQPQPSPANPDARLSREEAMLHYVAVTRARRVLDNSGLAWGHSHRQCRW